MADVQGIYRHRRGQETNRGNITPLLGEVIVTTDTHKIYIGDNSTAGGIEIAYINTSEKGSANGVATLDAGGKVPVSQLPALAITDVFVVGSESEQTALTAQEGDVAIRTDENKSYVHNGGTAGDMTDWQELLTPTDAVQSVNGQTGTVVLTTDDISEGTTNLYYTDARVDARIAITSIDALSDVDTSTNTPMSNQILAWDGTNWVPKDIADVSNPEAFTGLSDTPNSYTASDAGKVVRVNSTYDGLIFSTLTINDLSDVDTTTTAPANGDLLSFDGTNWIPIASGNVGRTTFLGLDDTPASYSGNGGKIVSVNSTEDALEFSSVIDAGSF